MSNQILAFDHLHYKHSTKTAKKDLNHGLLFIVP